MRSLGRIARLRSDFMAEREGFEPPIAMRLCLISSQAQNHKVPIFIRALFCAKLRCSLECQFAYPVPNESVCRAIPNDALIASDNEHAVRWVEFRNLLKPDVSDGSLSSPRHTM